MKKNKMMRVASALLVAVLLTTCAISGTFAKYVSQATGSDTARVAKWGFQLEGTAMTDTFTFDLFKTVKDSDGTSTETDIKAADGSIIAPGTSGSFEINLTNNSEVNAKYSVGFTVTNASVPLEFKVNDGAWTQSPTNVEFTNINMDASAAITVQWRWAFNNGDDAADTALGLAGTASPVVTATVTVEQVD